MSEHTSFAILPFEIRPFSQSNNPFDFEFNSFESLVHFTDFSAVLRSLSEESAIYKIDKQKYHYHIHHFITSGFLNDQRAQLSYYKIKPNLLFNSQKLVVGENWEVSFSGNTHVFINELIGIGYIVFGFKFTGKGSASLKEFSKLDFFRFYTNDKSFRKYAMQMINRDEEDINELNKLSLEDVISSSFKDLCPYIKLKYERPVLLHLSTNKGEISDADLDFFLYNSLRIQAKKLSDSISVGNNYSKKIGSGVYICVLNEGASIIDESVSDLKQLQSKYLTAFIMALNQRESMIHINQLSANLSLGQIQENSDAIMSFLNKSKYQIDLFRFKQMIYSISFFEEIVFFYKKLQIAMDIDLLLLDNKECVNEISNFIDESNRKQQVEMRRVEIDSQRKRDLWVNATLTGIGCLGIFSFFKDLIPFTFDDELSNRLGSFSSWYKIFSAISPLILFVGLLRLMRRGSLKE